VLYTLSVLVFMKTNPLHLCLPALFYPVSLSRGLTGARDACRMWDIVLSCFGWGLFYSNTGRASHGISVPRCTLTLLRIYALHPRQIAPCNNLLKSDCADLRVGKIFLFEPC